MIHAQILQSFAACFFRIVYLSHVSAFMKNSYPLIHRHFIISTKWITQRFECMLLTSNNTIYQGGWQLFLWCVCCALLILVLTLPRVKPTFGIFQDVFESPNLTYYCGNVCQSYIQIKIKFNLSWYFSKSSKFRWHVIIYYNTHTPTHIKLLTLISPWPFLQYI